MSKELERARALFIKRATRPERDALIVTEGHSKTLVDRAQRTRAKNRVPELRRRLEIAEKQEGEIFDAVIRGDRDP